MTLDGIQALVTALAALILTLGGFGGLLMPLVQGLTAGVKTVAGDRLPGAYLPGVAVFWGEVLSFLLIPLIKHDMEIQMLLSIGLVAGMMASGFYRGAAQAVNASLEARAIARNASRRG